MKLRLAMLSLSLAACLAKAKPVRMANGQEALRVECNYTIANCERKARQACDGAYEQLGGKGDMSCKDCGMELSHPDPYVANPEGNNVYKGTLYVRCR